VAGGWVGLINSLDDMTVSVIDVEETVWRWWSDEKRSAVGTSLILLLLLLRVAGSEYWNKWRVAGGLKFL